jgi:hypothetical protein
VTEPNQQKKPAKPKQGMPQRFAQGTDIPVSKTRQEIEDLVRRHGATQALSGSDFGVQGGFVAFTMAHRQIRFTLQPYSREGKVGRPIAPEQYERENWRALLLIIKGKLEAVRSGIVTVEREFLANIVLPNGKLLGEAIEPAVEAMYETGQMVGLLPDFDAAPRQLGRG